MTGRPLAAALEGERQFHIHGIAGFGLDVLVAQSRGGLGRGPDPGLLGQRARRPEFRFERGDGRVAGGGQRHRLRNGEWIRAGYPQRRTRQPVWHLKE
jgi:hypothetical protein